VKKNDLIENQEFEKMLKEKMNGLSANVDCFDKIAARAFPDKSEDFSDSELTVNELENITGKHRRLPVLKWVSVAAALVLVAGVLPKTIMMSNLKQRLMHKQDKTTYRELLSEIKSETENGSYTILDLPLDEYIANDVLITPFYSCPFGSSSKNNMNVRLYIRTVGDVWTNQIYAVEYSGEYSESSIVATASSKADFSDKEIEKLTNEQIKNVSSTAGMAAASELFSADGNNLIDENGDAVTAADFSGTVIYKSGDDICTVYFDTLYYHNGAMENGSYYYDTHTDCYVDGVLDASYIIPENDWKCSVNLNNNDAFPGSSGSAFERAELFSDANPFMISDNIFRIEPFAKSYAEQMLTDDKKLDLFLTRQTVSSIPFEPTAEISVPEYEAFQKTTSVFFPTTIQKHEYLDDIIIMAGTQHKGYTLFYANQDFKTSDDVYSEMGFDDLRYQAQILEAMINIHGSQFTDDQLIDMKKQLSRINSLIIKYSDYERTSAENQAEMQAEEIQRQAESDEQQRIKAEKTTNHKSDQTVTR